MPVTQANGAPATKADGGALTAVLVPKTDASGRVPTNADGSPKETVRIDPVTLAGGVVVTLPGGAPATQTQTGAPGGGGCSGEQIAACTSLCTFGVKTCSCSGASLDVQCMDAAALTPATSAAATTSTSMLGALSLLLLAVLN